MCVMCVYVFRLLPPNDGTQIFAIWISNYVRLFCAAIICLSFRWLESWLCYNMHVVHHMLTTRPRRRILFLKWIDCVREMLHLPCHGNWLTNYKFVQKFLLSRARSMHEKVMNFKSKKTTTNIECIEVPPKWCQQKYTSKLIVAVCHLYSAPKLEPEDI